MGAVSTRRGSALLSPRQRLCLAPLAAVATLIALVASLFPSPSPGAAASRLAPLLAHRVSAIGDSLMIDYAAALAHDVPGLAVNADVARQWSAGLTVVAQLRAAHQLGARVIIDLGTNGTVSAAQFDQMIAELRGAQRVVFVTVHVPRPWEAADNAVIRAGVARHRAVATLADWATLAAGHPSWFYSDGTHLPIDGPGARALAALVARALDAPRPVRARPAAKPSKGEKPSTTSRVAKAKPRR